MVNEWSGKIIEIKDLDTIESTNPDLQLENALEDYFFNHLCGISVLKGGGTLMPIWDDIEEENITRGMIGVVEFNQKKFLAEVSPDNVGNNLLHKFDRVSLTLLDNSDITLQSRKDYQDPKTGEKFPQGWPYRYVVFQNNRDSTPYLARLRYFIKQMAMCVKQMRKEIFMSEKRLLFILPEQPDEQDVKYFMQGWKKGTMVVITFQASRKPSKEDRQQGKEGISPHNINFQVYEPKTDQCAWLIRNFNFWLSLAEKMIGIRSDTVGKEKERAPVAEVLNSQASFDSFEKKGWKIRIKGIREYMAVFGERPEEVNYELQYGRVNGKA